VLIEMTRLSRPVLLASCALAAHVASAASWTPTPHGAIVTVPGGWSLELAVEGLSSFRVSATNGGALAQVATSMVAKKTAYAVFAVAASGASGVNLSTSFGSLLVDTATGAFALADSSGTVLTYTPSLLAASADTFGSSRYAMAAGAGPGPSTVFTLGRQGYAAYMGSGTEPTNVSTLWRVGMQAMVHNKGSVTPSFWSSAGFSVLAVSPYEDAMDGTDGSNTYPMKWAVNADGAGGNATVTVLGGAGGQPSVDLYLSPAAGLREHTAAQAVLEGLPPVPPRYAMGFFACRWGWVNQSYIEGVLAEFRAGAYPVDSMISDFEWFTPTPDYSLNASGDPAYHDFAFNNITFPPPQGPLLARYRSQYNIRFGGIRKPRYGNSTLIIMARANGWLMGQGGVPGATPDSELRLPMGVLLPMRACGPCAVR